MRQLELLILLVVSRMIQVLLLLSFVGAWGGCRVSLLFLSRVMRLLLSSSSSSVAVVVREWDDATAMLYVGVVVE